MHKLFRGGIARAKTDLTVKKIDGAAGPVRRGWLAEGEGGTTAGPGGPPGKMDPAPKKNDGDGKGAA